MSEKRARLASIGINIPGDISDAELAGMSPQEIAMVAGPKSQREQPSLLGSQTQPTSEEYGGGMTYPEQTEVTTPKEGGGTPGTWETAMMAVAKTVPSIIQASQFRRPYAPAANVSGRRTMDIPSAASTFGKNDPRFQSLLAMFLKR